MMDFELNSEEKLIQKAIRDFVTKELPQGVVRELDGMGQFPEKQLTALSKLGFLGLTIPEAFDGEGVNIVEACIVAEELAMGYPALAACYANAVFGSGAVLATLGSEDQKSRFLPGIARGELWVALALLEADDDAGGIETRAAPEGAGVVISGEKPLVALGDVADAFLVLARTGKTDDLALYCVDGNAPGITRNRVDTLGMHGENLVNVVFDRVWVESQAILGGMDRQMTAPEQLEMIQNYQLLGIGAQALGMARGAFGLALSHAKNRVQFDQVIGKFTAIQEKLTDLLCDIAAAKFLVYNAALVASTGKKFTREVAMAKIKAARIAVQASMDGLQVFGGYGYSMEYDIQRYVRDAAGTLSAGISNESLGLKIAKSMGL
ncbi:MAG: acyl-CoA dehydrogenase family protein [Desulfobacterium sp.]|nr:acyl-CoA dehydrogenase family protein [Desulfobacterium sp.]